MTETAHTKTTVLDALTDALERASQYDQNTHDAPVAVLWTDGASEWLKVVPLVRARVLHLLTLGDYDPAQRIGPVIWLKCAIARVLDEVTIPEGTVPILYLPGVSRDTLRKVEHCPERYQPLVELQFRGKIWSHENGKDWTVFAFLKTERDGLGLDVAEDRATREAIAASLTRLVDTPVESLRGRRLEQEDFRSLVAPDPEKALLEWLNDSDTATAMWSEDDRTTFYGIYRDRYGFDVVADGEIIASEHLAAHVDAWKSVWDRFAEAPKRYPGIIEQLRTIAPPKEASDCSAYPSYNAEEEIALRDALRALADVPEPEAKRKIAELEAQHGVRRLWVWAELDEAPLACALEHLAYIAEHVAPRLGGSTPDDMAKAYISSGWEIDAAALSAMAAVVSDADSRAVHAALKALYEPWLSDAARHLQEIVRSQNYPCTPDWSAPLDDVQAGECILFADGLRFDLGMKLSKRLETSGMKVDISRRWAAFPTVTATSKPAVSPIVSILSKSYGADEFRPVVADTLQPLTPDRFRSLLKDAVVQFLSSNDTGDPSGRGWIERGELDRTGHDENVKLARRIDEHLSGLVNLVRTLIDAGWKKVRIVTDHGWLLLPTGLPKVELKVHEVEERWGRCAVLRDDYDSSYPVLNWFWNPEVRVVSPPGIGCFRAGSQYAHGGLSLQECVVPVLGVTVSAPMVRPTLAPEQWRRLRCNIGVDNAQPGLRVDIRRKVNDASTTLAEGGKELREDGSASLVVTDDRLEKSVACIVLLDAAGQVIDKRDTTIGGS